MLRKDTPPKHQTPNYRLVAIRARPLPQSGIVTLFHEWRPVPLRAGRKDLK